MIVWPVSHDEEKRLDATHDFWRGRVFAKNSGRQFLKSLRGRVVLITSRVDKRENER